MSQSLTNAPKTRGNVPLNGGLKMPGAVRMPPARTLPAGMAKQKGVGPGPGNPMNGIAKASQGRDGGSNRNGY